jgi:hypothetical protein
LRNERQDLCFFDTKNTFLWHLDGPPQKDISCGS